MMTTKTAGLPAAAYVRISADLAGEGLGVERQTEDTEALAGALGCRVVKVFRDNDISASTISQKPRPEYAAMLEAVRSGQVKVVLAYSNSRLTRRPRELEDLIDLHRETGVIIKTVVSGDDDLSTADGRMVARIKANVDAAEAERTSERVRRQKQQRLAAGKPPASRYRTFGYTKAWEVIPEEAAIVREVFERVASGESMNAVTRDLQARGIKRVSGEDWAFQATSRMLRSHIYEGFVSYKGQRGVKATGVDALVSEDLFAAATTGTMRRPGSRPNTRQTLLSGIAVCDVCKTPMVGSKNSSVAVYSCNAQAGGCGNVRHKREWLDDVIESNIWQVLAHDYRSREDKPTVDKTADLVAALDDRIRKTQEALTGGVLAYEDGLPMLADLRAQKKALAEAEIPMETFHKVLTDFRSADVSAQTAEVRRHVSAILVKPNPKRGNSKFEPNRFDVVLRDGTVIPGPQFIEEGFAHLTAVKVGG